jgi:hypothetical protein
MDSRIALVIDKLKENGWTTSLADHTPEWWMDEIVEMKSAWNPVGASIYLIVNVDPAVTGNRKKGECVISVSLSKKIPADRLSGELYTFYLLELNAIGVNRVVETANQLRDEIKDFFTNKV